MFLLMYILLQIDPGQAVQNISLDYGILGSLFIINLSFLVAAIIYIRKTFARQISDLSIRLDKTETKAETGEKEFRTYLQEKNTVFVEVIKEYSESRENSRIIMEKLLLKL